MPLIGSEWGCLKSASNWSFITFPSSSFRTCGRFKEKWCHFFNSSPSPSLASLSVWMLRIISYFCSFFVIHNCWEFENHFHTNLLHFSLHLSLRILRIVSYFLFLSPEEQTSLSHGIPNSIGRDGSNIWMFFRASANFRSFYVNFRRFTLI